MSEKYLLFIALALLNPTLENLGLGFQKWAIDRSPHTKSKIAKAGWTVIWTIGLLMTIAVGIIAFKLLSLGNSSTAGALAGFGLVPLTIFSYFVLKEKIVAREYLGIFIIMTGVSILGYFSHGSQKEHVELNYTGLYIFLAGYVVFLIAGAILAAKKRDYMGIILGIMAGSMAATGFTIQKSLSQAFMAFFKNFGGAEFKVIASNPLTYIMLLLAVGGITTLQFAYKHGKAVQIVPARATIYIITPLIGGMAFLGESIPALAFVGIVIVMVGVFITTTANPSKLAH